MSGIFVLPDMDFLEVKVLLWSLSLSCMTIFGIVLLLLFFCFLVTRIFGDLLELINFSVVVPNFSVVVVLLTLDKRLLSKNLLSFLLKIA